MSPDELVRTVIHPYKANNPKTHGHFLDIDEHFVPYSLPARPFLWTMKRGKDFEKYDIDYQASREPELDFENDWVQDAARLPETHSFCRRADDLEIMIFFMIICVILRNYGRL